MAQDLDGVDIILSSFPQPPQQIGEPPPPAPPLQEPQGPQGQQQQEQQQQTLTPAGYAAHGPSLVTPDEVLTLGVLALAGLWPGCWSGIAAIIVHKVERLAQGGAADAPFRQCAQSLVNLLLQSPGETSLAAETWVQIIEAQARLPDELGKVLGLACSLLQRRSLEVTGTRVSKKRRRDCSSVAALAAPIPQLPAPDATTLLSIVSGVACDEDEKEELKKKRKKKQQQQEQLQRQKRRREQELEDTRKRQREIYGSSAPRLLPPSEVLPLLLQQPQPAPSSAEAAETSAAAEVSSAAATAAAAAGAAAVAMPSHPQIPPQSQFSAEGEAHPVQPHPPQLYSVAPGLGGTEVDFPNLLPPSVSVAPSPSRPTASWDINGGHHALQASDAASLLHPAPEVDYPSPHLAAASEPVVAPPTNEAVSDVSSSIP